MPLSSPGPKPISLLAFKTRFTRSSAGEFLFDGQKVGRYVRHGGKARLPGRLPPAVFASRVYLPGVKIEEEAGSVTALHNKVARALWTAHRAGIWTPPGTPA